MAVRSSDEVLAGHVHVVVVSVADEREVFDVGEATLAPLGEVMHLAPLMRLATPRVLAMPVTCLTFTIGGGMPKSVSSNY